MNLKVIESISFAKLTNAYHVSFLSNVRAGIDKYGAEDLGLDATLYGSFCSFLETEQDIVNRVRAPHTRYSYDDVQFSGLTETKISRCRHCRTPGLLGVHLELKLLRDSLF